MRTKAIFGAAVLLSLGAASRAWAACEAPGHHRLDFWLGKWGVRDGNEVAAESSIERSPEGCAVIERYRQRDGYSGTSINFHDPLLHRWRQSWVDTACGVGEFTGEPGEGEMRFPGETRRPDGTRVLRRMTLTRLPDGSVRPQGGGRTYSVSFTM